MENDELGRADDVERLSAEIAAWGNAASGLEAYLKDRINNCDPPSWEKVLSVWRADMKGLELRSRQIYAATQSNANSARLYAERMAAERDQLFGAVEYAHSEGFQWPADPIPETMRGHVVTQDDARKDPS